MFRVIIGGGSVAGLTTALLLEAANIDYVLLESREIAPAVGASLGLWPNGFRILDQLGLYEKVLDVTVSASKTTMHRRDGQVISDPTAGNDVDFILERLGYPSCFLDRQTLLEIMFDHIKNKDKILTRKRITHVEHSDESVVVTCADGSTFVGDVLVGADGVHSYIRKEMWSLIDREDPTMLPPGEKTAITVSFSALFGIANPVPGVEAGSIYMAHQENAQLMTVGGKNGRCYFFIFKRLDRTYKAPDLPKFTVEDRDTVAEFHRSHKANSTISFGDIWDNKIMGTYLPLEESAFTRYAYKRIVMVGDSIHKPTPATGQGGNGAIESATVLVNLLVRALARHKQCKEGHLSLGELVAVGDEYTTIRATRMSEMIKMSHKANNFSLLSSKGLWLMEALLPLIPPALHQKGMSKVLLDPLLDGPYVEFLPVKDRKGTGAWKNTPRK